MVFIVLHKKHLLLLSCIVLILKACCIMQILSELLWSSDSLHGCYRATLLMLQKVSLEGTKVYHRISYFIAGSWILCGTTQVLLFCS